MKTKLLAVLLLIPWVLLAQRSKNMDNHTKNKDVSMSTIATNKKIVRSLYEDILNLGHLEKLGDIISNEFTGPGGEKGTNAFKQPVMGLINAMPDVQWTLEELVADEEKVAVSWLVQGTHTGKFQHVAPTGRSVSNKGMAFFDLKDDKITGSRVYTDRLGFLQGLGVLPVDLSLLPAQAANEQQVQFIDKFLLPAGAKAEFLQRAHINRNFIKTLPGFVHDIAYERLDDDGNTIYITIATWASEQALNDAKEAVQKFYKQESFNPAEMMQRLHISIDRGLYRQEVRH